MPLLDVDPRPIHVVWNHVPNPHSLLQPLFPSSLLHQHPHHLSPSPPLHHCAVQCMSTRPALVQFGVPYYEVGSLAMMPGYQPRSPECGADN